MLVIFLTSPLDVCFLSWKWEAKCFAEELESLLLLMRSLVVDIFVVNDWKMEEEEGIKF